MQQTITAKLKLKTTPEQYEALRRTQLAYRDALNYVSRYSFEHGKLSSARRLQQGTYDEIRVQFRLPSQLACSAIRQVAATYKGLWTKLKRNIEHRRAKITRKRFKGLEKPPKYGSPTLTYVDGHDYSFKTGQRVSVLTMRGRVIVGYSGHDKHLALIKNGAEIGEAKLWYDKPRKQFYLLVSLELDRADPTPESLTSITGVDVGMRYLATAATVPNESQFHSGTAARAKADHYARLRKRLQRKGTRSATRRLIAISGRERRLKLQTNHIIAKSIVEAHPHSLIGLEELTGIREHTRRRAKRRKRDGKSVEPPSPKARRANRYASRWAFAELQSMVAYKAALAGSIAVKVDADYTSKACPLCGYSDKKNRPQNGLLFVCQNEQCSYRLSHGRPYKLHADLVGARNIAMRTFCVRQDWAQTGQLSVAPGSLDDPDASDEEAKAARLARLARYAELRWSSDASFLHEREAI
jgi:putative transposase